MVRFRPLLRNYDFPHRGIKVHWSSQLATEIIAPQDVLPKFTQPRSMMALVENLRDHPSVTSRQFIELKSAAKVVCKTVGRDSKTWMIGKLGDVLDLMHAVNPVQAGIDEGYWRATRSKVTRVMRFNGFEMLSCYRKTELTPAWSILVRKAEALKKRRIIPLRPFIAHMIAVGLEPGDVTQTTFEDYLACVELRSPRKNKVGTGPQLRAAWNDCLGSVEGWPQILFKLVDGRNIYLMPDSTFPQILEEFETFVTRPLSPRGTRRRRRRVREVTIESCRYHFRRMLSAAIQGGIEAARLRTLADFCDPEVLETAFNFILDRRGAETTCDVSRLANLAVGIAEHWARVSEERLEDLKNLYEDFACIQEGMTEKNRRMLQKFANNKIVTNFLATPKRVVARYADIEVLTVHDAIQIQLATAMAVLIRVLVRVHNLKQIRIGHHLIEVGYGADRKYVLCFSKDEVKNDEYLETILSPRVSAILKEYILRARPVLLREPSDYLFPGLGTGHKSGSMFSQQLASFTEKESGIRVTAHQFRHLGGFIHLLKFPGDYEGVRKMLGHRKVETTIKFYIGLENRAAFEKYDAHIDTLLDQSEEADAMPAKVRLKRRA